MRRGRWSALSLLALDLALVVMGPTACTTGRGSVLHRPARVLDGVKTEAPVGPPRWVLTQQLGGRIDAAPHSNVEALEPVIIGGARVLVDAGVVVGSAVRGERLTGFRSLPRRLGKGYVLWSDERIYRADAFLGAMDAIADVDAVGGIRPWLRGMLVRSERGTFVLDPFAAADHVRPLDMPGIADAAAVDAERAVRLDLLGRASYTVDGGKSWTDVLATRGFVATEITEAEDGIWLGSSGGPLELDARGRLVGPDDAPRTGREEHSAGKRRAVLGQPPPRSAAAALAPDAVAHAVIASAPLPGGGALVAHEGGLRIVATSSARVLREVDVGSLEERYRRCQPYRDGAHVLLACAHDQGASMLALSDAFGDPRIEMSFGGTGAFVGGPRGEIAFVGRCGSARAASSSERNADPYDEGVEGVRRAASGTGSPQGHGSTAQSPPADARLCVRLHSGAWLERRLVGDDARRLYRWIVGEDGEVTALVLADPAGACRSDGPSTSPCSGAHRRDADGGASSAAGDAATPRAGPTSHEGVRVIRIDAGGRSFAGAQLVAPASPMRDAPFRVIDDDFWQEGRGAIRGWVEVSGKPTPAGPKGSPAPAPILGRVARVAGVRIELSGKATVLPLPPGTVAVVRGGRYGVASAEVGGKHLYYETTDGGESWRPIDPPPLGELDASTATNGFSGCSWMGCTWAGIVRLGWGGASGPPSERAVPVQKSGQLVRAPSPPALTCRLRDEARTGAKPGGSAEKPPSAGSSSREPRNEPPRIVSLFSRASEPLGAVRSGVWSSEVFDPFDPSAAPRRVSVRDPALTGRFGSIAPLIGARSVAPVLFFGERMLRLDGAPKPRRFDYAGPFAAMLEGERGDVLALDAGRGAVVLAHGDMARSVARIARTPDVERTRITFARRVDAPGYAVVAISTGSGVVVAGDLDLGRAVVGPLATLGGLASLVDASHCSSDARDAGGARRGAPTYRFIAELPMALTLADPAGAAIETHPATTALVLLTAASGRLCVEAVEAELPERDGEIVAAFSGAPAAAVRRPTGERLAATCSFEPGR